MQIIKLRSANKSNVVHEFKALIVNSSVESLVLSLNKSEDIKEFYIGQRFIIGEYFPRPYEIAGINEYDERNYNGVIFYLRLTQQRDKDNLKEMIAYNG